MQTQNYRTAAATVAVAVFRSGMRLASLVSRSVMTGMHVFFAQFSSPGQVDPSQQIRGFWTREELHQLLVLEVCFRQSDTIPAILYR